MQIIVCIKQVPDTTEVEWDEETGRMKREGVQSIVNPFDENAIEEALLLREKHGGAVIVLTMGPPQAEEALRSALAMGADEAVLLTSPDFGGADTLATSYTLAQTIRKIGEYDVIICGRQAFDGDTGQVGPGLAEHLGIPQITYAIGVEVTDRKCRVRRLLENGFEVVEARMPVLMTVVKQINEPRHPRLRNVLAAKKKEVTVWGPEDIDVDPERCGLQGSPTRVVRVFKPERAWQGEMLEGSAEEQSQQLVEKLIAADIW
ncbi:MAG: electron transfer flavoprotein subunit beta/FixA family protein [Armatimonadota bacterium]